MRVAAASLRPLGAPPPPSQCGTSQGDWKALSGHDGWSSPRGSRSLSESRTSDLTASKPLMARGLDTRQAGHDHTCGFLNWKTPSNFVRAPAASCVPYGPCRDEVQDAEFLGFPVPLRKRENRYLYKRGDSPNTSGPSASPSRLRSPRFWAGGQESPAPPTRVHVPDFWHPEVTSGNGLRERS